MPLPLILPMRLSRAKEPFDDPNWLFELKHDGFRSLAYLENGQCRLISRNGHQFRGFADLCDSIASAASAKEAILDGEICCLGPDGRSVFNQLMFRRGTPYYYAFDLLWLNGRDLRNRRLLDRKERLRRIIPDGPARILYTSHLEEKGMELFQAACEMDLEGIVAKKKDAPYYSNERHTSWIKIKNRQYSQIKGRQEMFAGSAS